MPGNLLNCYTIYSHLLLGLFVTLEAVNSAPLPKQFATSLPSLVHFSAKNQAQKLTYFATKKGYLCCKIISTVFPLC